ncbi:hypothetical protein [Virgibacillus proomii]
MRTLISFIFHYINVYKIKLQVFSFHKPAFALMKNVVL